MKPIAGLALGLIIGLTASLMLGSIATAEDQAAYATMINDKGESIGIARLVESASGDVRVTVELKGITPGEHGFHVHETGTCKTPDFESAGGHFNPTDKMHGMEVPTGPHAGDLPNVIVSADGSGRVNTLNPYLTLAQGSETSLIKEGGTALIVHAGSDDYDSQPTGGAGPRLACGEIQGG